MLVSRITLTAVFLSLAACGSETSGTFETEDGESGEYSIDNSTGETVVSVETDEGQATLRSGADVEVDLPGGFTIIDGAEVVNNMVFDNAGDKGALISFISDKSPEEIAEFYRAQAEAAGVEIQIETSINGGKMLGGESADGTTFSVTAYPQGEGDERQITGQLTISSGSE